MPRGGARRGETDRGGEPAPWQNGCVLKPFSGGGPAPWQNGCVLKPFSGGGPAPWQNGCVLKNRSRRHGAHGGRRWCAHCRRARRTLCGSSSDARACPQPGSAEPSTLLIRTTQSVTAHLQIHNGKPAGRGASAGSRWGRLAQVLFAHRCIRGRRPEAPLQPQRPVGPPGDPVHATRMSRERHDRRPTCARHDGR